MRGRGKGDGGDGIDGGGGRRGGPWRGSVELGLRMSGGRWGSREVRGGG